jgi:hypothetical protein
MLPLGIIFLAISPFAKEGILSSLDIGVSLKKYSPYP